ncbi:MAG: UDP-N-acetylmuramate dehydrogenase [Bacilli bacterium]|nr:UDP-N-acetylmuramate dehydrogenase [Bacilli bacterium]
MEKISNALIKDYTTYKLDGFIKEIVFPKDVLELKELLESLKGKKYKIIGNGSNLILDESYDGVLINLKYFNNIEFNDNIVKVGAGYSLPKFALECANKGLSGLVFAAGIPGTIGGAIYMNAGAYGKEISDILESVTVLDDNLNVKVLTKNELETSYRDSIFKHTNYVCLEAIFCLEYGDKETILKEIREIIETRKAKQPLEYPSAGSVFKNGEGYSAGRLIEKAGLKGTRVGDAEVSLKHANFIVNRGNAKALDVINLIDIIKKKIKEEDNVDLILEQEILK